MVWLKEIESALGNKTMNDASKKILFELLGLGVGWRKKWKERQLAAKEKWKIRVDGSEMKKRLRGNM